jgi:predicted metallopeptidase
LARHQQDETGELWKIAKAIIKADKNTVVDGIDVTTFWDLRHLKFLMTFRDEPRKDEEKRVATARVKVLSPELRDLFGKDIHIEVCQPIWDDLSVRWRQRVIKHELRHISITFDEDAYGETGKRVPKLDKEGRIKCSTVPHDIVLKTFEDDIAEWGLSENEMALLSRLKNYYKAARKGDLDVYQTPQVMVDGPQEEDAA